MRVLFEMFLDNREKPKYAVRSAELFDLMAKKLRNENNARDPNFGRNAVSSEGQGVSIGMERLTVLEIDRSIVFPPLNEDK